VQATIYSGKKILVIRNGKEKCNWLSNENHSDHMKPIAANMKIKVLPEGIRIVKPGKNETFTKVEKYPGFVFPFNEEVHWEEDFYKVAW